MFNKLFKAEGGFTLIELLVTIAILGVLFGIVTLTLSGVGSDAADTVCDAELAVVQSAMDIWLAVDATNAIIADPAGAVAIIKSGEAKFADSYLRDLPTEYEYYWTATGDVTCADVP